MFHPNGQVLLTAPSARELCPSSWMEKQGLSAFWKLYVRLNNWVCQRFGSYTFALNNWETNNHVEENTSKTSCLEPTV